MTDPIVTIEPAEISVEPGGQARIEVTIRNPSAIVESYRLEVLAETPGDGPAAWAEVHPAEVRVYPKEKAAAIVVFAPPAGLGALSGKFAFGIRAVSTIPPGEAAGVAEGDLEVGRVFGLQASITPTMSSGRWRGRHLLRYTNWGNAPVHLQVTARDPDERLGFLVRPAELDVPLGGTATARLTARARKPFLRGQQARLPFEVVAEQDQPGYQPPSASLPGDPRRPLLNGVLMQKPIVSRGTMAVAALAVIALAGALVLALRTPKSTPTFQELGPPPRPIGLAAKAQKDGSIQLIWTSVHNVGGYKLIQLNNGIPGRATDVSADLRSFTTPALTALTTYCFQLKAVRGKFESLPSNQACQRTLPPPVTSSAASSGAGSSGAGSSASGGPSSGASSGASSGQTSGASTGASSGASSSGSPTGTSTAVTYQPGQWVVFIGDYFLDSDPKANQKAHAFAAKLSTEDQLAVNVLHNTDYPHMKVAANTPKLDFYVVYIDGFNDALDASAFARSCKSEFSRTCTTAQPAGP